MNRKKVRNKKQELRQIKNEVRASTSQVERREHKKRKKKKQQEIFRLRERLRAANKQTGSASVRPDPRMAGEAGTGALPDFVVIGAKKCGTSSFYHNLTRHPNVEPAAFKETHYFTSHYDEGIEWYRRCFPPPKVKDGQKSITGEATPGYLIDPLVPERMAEVIPRARLIALLRNPVDRAYSDYQQLARKGRDPRSFDETIEKVMGAKKARPSGTGAFDHDDGFYRSYLSRGVYVDQLLHWSRFFDDEQILVLKSEDFFERPSDTMRLVLGFLDLPDWEPEAWKIRKQGSYEEKIDPTTRQRLEDYFEPHNQRLYEYLGVNLGW